MPVANSFVAQAQYASNICETASLALFLYDYMLTLFRERELIWKRKLTVPNFLFLVNRYGSMAAKFLLASRNLLGTDESCLVSYMATVVILLAVYAALGLCASLRIYAIWNRGRLPASLVLLSLAIHSSIEIFLVTRARVYFSRSPVETCVVDFSVSESLLNKLSDISSTATFFSAISTITLTWMRTYDIMRLASQAKIKASVATLLLRDGTILWGVILCVSVSEFVLFKLNVGFNPIPAFYLPIASILMSRFSLSLREVCQYGSGNAMASTLDSIEFANIALPSHFVGLIGAPLGRDDSGDEDDVAPEAESSQHEPRQPASSTSASLLQRNVKGQHSDSPSLI